MPAWLRYRVMARLVRDAHHYFFNLESAPRAAARYRARDEIRRRFVDALRAADHQRPLVAVTHSMGTMIAYDCLKHVADCPPLDGLITVGSPLGLDEVQDFYPSWSKDDGFPSERLQGPWVNVYDPLDVVAGLQPRLAPRLPPPRRPRGGGRARGQLGYLATQHQQVPAGPVAARTHLEHAGPGLAMTGWPEATAALLEAGTSRDKHATWQAAIDLLPWLSDVRHPVEPLEARRLLWQAAIQHRWFEIAEVLACAMASRLGAPPALKRLHAQMLLERGFDDEALARLDDLRRAADLTDYDRGEVLGHLGRIHKDRFVAAVRAADTAAEQHLSRAIEAYRAGYDENPSRDWLGINAVALLSREEARAVRPDAGDEARGPK